MKERENALRYFRGEEYDHLPYGNWQRNIEAPVCERPLYESGYDVFSVHWSLSVAACHYTNGQPPILEDVENWREEVKFPQVERFDWESVKREAEALDRENFVVTSTLIMGAFERTTSLSTFEDCLVNCISQPEDYADLVGAIVDYKIQVVHRLWEAARPDLITLHDDWGTSNNLLISPKLWRQTVKPHTKRLYDACKEHGMLICQHSCGRVESLVGDMVEMGADAWEGQMECNDFAALREKYAGKIRLMSRGMPAELVERPPAEGPGFNVWETPSMRRAVTPYPEKPDFLYL